MIALVSEISWNALNQRPHHFALALSKLNGVLWIQPRTSQNRLGLKQVGENIWTFTVWQIPRNARNPLLKKAMRFIPSAVSFLLSVVVWRQVRRRFPEIRTFLVNNTELAWAFNGRIVLDVLDQPLNLESFRDVLHKAKDVIVSSQTLLEYTGGRGNVVGNGCEYKHFQPKQYQCGYVGYVGDWFNFDCIKGLDCVLIGSARPEVMQKIRESGATYIGMLSYREIPKFLNLFRVGIIPFQCTEFTRHVNPVKMYEYLANGKPVVCTPFSPNVEGIKGVRVVPKEQFQQAVLNAQGRNTEVAKANDWTFQTQKLLDCISESVVVAT